MADRILFLETPDIANTPVGEKNEYTADEKQKLAGIEAGAQKNTVDSVNGKTGPVTLDAADVGALPSNTPIPAAVTEQTVAGWGFTKNTGDYSKPSGGIPKTDLASDVKESLGKADTALQQHQSLTGYATETWVTEHGYQTATDVQAAISGVRQLPTVSATDNGKFLRVVNGAWVAQTIPSAEGASF